MVTEDLYSQLKNKNPRLRERAMGQIADERTEKTIPQLMAILDSEDVVYRRAAVQTLGLIGLDSVPSLVEQLINSENETVRASCAKALAAITLNFPEDSFPPSALEALKGSLTDENPVVKISAVGALGTVGPPAFEILAEALKIDDLALQVALINALGSLGDQRGMSLLGAISADESADPYLIESAKSALSRLEQVINYVKASPSYQ